MKWAEEIAAKSGTYNQRVMAKLPAAADAEPDAVSVGGEFLPGAHALVHGVYRSIEAAVPANVANHTCLVQVNRAGGTFTGSVAIRHRSHLS